MIEAVYVVLTSCELGWKQLKKGFGEVFSLTFKYCELSGRHRMASRLYVV